MIRDNSFNSMNFEKTAQEADENSLPYQVLQAIKCLPELGTEVQIEFLKVCQTWIRLFNFTNVLLS